jgi:hypothetical protein
MATLEGAIYTYMTTTPSIAAYVGADVYHGAAPDGIDSTFIRYQIIMPSNEPYSFASSNTAQPEVQIDIFSKSDADCIALGNIIATALNRLTGDFGMLCMSEGILMSTTLYMGGSSLINVIFSTASGPMVMRDPSDEQWWHGIVYWTPEYER